MHLQSIHVYPLKSARGVSLQSGTLDDFGLEHDRRWMLVDSSGTFISRRTHHQLALVDVQMDGSTLIVRAPGRQNLVVARPGPGTLETMVRVWDSECVGQDAGAGPASWFSDFLGQHLRLVYMPSTTFRRANPDYVREPRRVSFADAYPVLLIGEGSWKDLNARLASPLPMNRFRPNLVIAGTLPFEEDRWASVRVGKVVFDVVKPCDRCVATTIDNDTAGQGKEPLQTLAKYRKWNGQVYFGQNAVHQSGGTLHLGDEVEPLRSAPARPPLVLS
jgi:uncharacterized protein